jgi:hypothetical protein
MEEPVSASENQQAHKKLYNRLKRILAFLGEGTDQVALIQQKISCYTTRRNRKFLPHQKNRNKVYITS